MRAYIYGIEQFPSACQIGLTEMECLYCPQLIPRPPKPGKRCPRCRESLIDGLCDCGYAHPYLIRACKDCAAKWACEFGPQWYLQDWHTEFLQSHREFSAPLFTRAGAVISLQDTDIAEDEVNEPLSGAWLPSLEYYEVFQLIRAAYLVHGCGWRKIKKLLPLYNVSMPSDATIKKYLRIIKAESLQEV